MTPNHLDQYNEFQLYIIVYLFNAYATLVHWAVYLCLYYIVYVIRI